MMSSIERGLGRPIALLALGLVLGACDRSETPSAEDATAQTGAEQPAAAPVVEAAVDDPLVAALSAPGRFERDLERDAGRRPDEIVRFMGVEPGMAILDMFSGGGYYSEYLSYVVGESGSILAHNNQAFVSFVSEELEARYLPGRLPNVTRVELEAPTLADPESEIDLGEGVYDGAFMILAYHDVYYVQVDQGWPEIDGPALLAAVHRALKPGGFLAVVDHAASEGAGTGSVQSLHRIEESALIADMQAAGFVLEAESDVLRNPEDDLAQPMFAEGIRGKTDRFVLRFRRP